MNNEQKKMMEKILEIIPDATFRFLAAEDLLKKVKSKETFQLFIDLKNVQVEYRYYIDDGFYACAYDLYESDVDLPHLITIDDDVNWLQDEAKTKQFIVLDCDAIELARLAEERLYKLHT